MRSVARALGHAGHAHDHVEGREPDRGGVHRIREPAGGRPQVGRRGLTQPVGAHEEPADPGQVRRVDLHHEGGAGGHRHGDRHRHD